MLFRVTSQSVLQTRHTAQLGSNRRRLLERPSENPVELNRFSPHRLLGAEQGHARFIKHRPHAPVGRPRDQHLVVPAVVLEVQAPLRVADFGRSFVDGLEGLGAAVYRRAEFTTRKHARRALPKQKD